MSKRLSWGLYGAALILVMLFLQILQWPLTPHFVDIYYHLLAAQNFDRAGGLVLNAFWEYAPTGRPHLYAPLLHGLILGLFKMGLPPIAAGRLVECALWPALLTVVALRLRGLFGSRVAFFSLLVFSGSFPVYLSSVTYPAFTLALLLGFSTLSFVERGKWFTAAVALAGAFYAHTGFGFFWLSSFVLYAILNPDKRKTVGISSVAALLFALPWFCHQWEWRELFQTVRLRDDLRLMLDPWTWIAAVAGLVVAWKQKGARLFFLASFICALGFSFFYPFRFLCGAGMIAAAVLAGMALDEACKRCEPKLLIFTTALLVWFAAAAPYIQTDLKTGQWELRFFDRTLSHAALSARHLDVSAKEASIYFEDEYEKIAAFVQANTKPDEAVWSDFDAGASIVAILTGRRMSAAMLSEVRAYQDLDPKKNARVLFWFKRADGQPPAGMEDTVRDGGLLSAGETSMTYLFTNPNVLSPSPVPAPILPSGWFLVLVLLPMGTLFLRSERAI